MKAVVIGPGRVGCGFAGQLLSASGYSLTFIGRNAAKLDRLNRLGRYRVRLSNGAKTEEAEIGGVQAIAIEETSRAAEAIAQADLVATAVGPGNLAQVAPLIAEGLAGRRSPVNVLAFENLDDAGALLRKMVTKRLGAERAKEHGFAGALVYRAISRLVMEPEESEPITLIGDPISRFVVDGHGLRDPRPDIAGMEVVGNYEAHARCKLFTFSAGHATCAYLGYLKGYNYVHSAIRDPEIRAIVRQAMAEGQAGLAARYGDTLAGHPKVLGTIMKRFENAVLNDPVTRVARDPWRKLAPSDRLIGTARLAYQAGTDPVNLATAVAAALHYRNQADRSAVSLEQEIAQRGMRAAIQRVCAVDSRNHLGRLITTRYHRFAQGWHRENHLIEMGSMMWAFRAPTRHKSTADYGGLTALGPIRADSLDRAAAEDHALLHESTAEAGRGSLT